MAATKSSTTATWASGSATASGTTNTISTATTYENAWYFKNVVVGTPTVAATVTIQQSPDGSTLYTGPTFSIGNLTAGTYYLGPIALDPSCQLTDVIYTAQTGGTSSTLTLQLGGVTGI